jgi:hypothetical protein
MATEEKNPAALPSISVIVLAHNPGPEMAECLEPLRRSSYPRFYPRLLKEYLEIKWTEARKKIGLS